MRSSDISGGSEPRGDGGSDGDGWVEIDTGGRKEYDRSKDESVMKAPVRPMPAEQFTMTGGFGSSVSDVCILLILSTCTMKFINA